MTTAPEQSSADRRRELVEIIRQELYAAAGPVCVRADIKAYLVVGVTQLTVHALDAQHKTVTFAVPTSIQTHLRELRQLMYVPGRGTWFSARLLLDAERLGIVYNDEFDPVWQPGIAPAEWVRDLEWFPRDPEHVPDWLRGYLREAGVPVPEVVPASPAPVSGPVDERERKRLLLELVDRWIHELPPLFASAAISVVAYGDYFVTAATMMSSLVGIVRIDVPPEVEDKFRHLRSATYRPGEGAWLHTQVQVWFPDDYNQNNCEYHPSTWDEMSRLDQPNAADCAKELERFPRDPEHVPAWMRETLAADQTSPA